MTIGFDAKRIFQNNTGLGNYSRSLLASLATQYPQHQYTLFTAKKTALFDETAFTNISLALPKTLLDSMFPSLWRSRNMIKQAANTIDLFHGLSNELPAGIKKSGVKSVVTIHDLIFEHYPETYPLDQRYVHRWKMKYSCAAADAVIAASNQTKKDLIAFYKIPQEKIFVCYQSCNSIFEKKKPILPK